MIRIILLLIFATKLMSKDIQEFALSIIAHPPLISLKQALNEAKKQNYDLQKEYKQLQIASSARDKSFAPLIPRLDFFLAKEAKLFQNNENDNDKAVFKLETKLFDMKSLFAVKSSSDELRAAKYNYEQASNKIFFEVRSEERR
ncbi:MAG: TolC family protein, partial [Myxococcales bacterium]|nr:TolC family protein [Myxococcales bacterium]